MVGIYFFVAGILAYVLVGHRVSLEPVYCSRHQILLGIGFALVLLDFLIYLKHIKRAFILLLSFCVIGNIDVFLKFQAVHYAQLALMTEMGKQEQLIAGGNFCIINALPDSPFFNDLQTQHSYCGMAKKTFGDETRFLIDKHAYTKCLLSGYGINVRKATYMNMKDMTFNGTFDYFMIIDSGTLLLKNHGSVLKIMFEEYFAKDKFVKDIDELLTITCVPYQQ
ncbi:hypothetical protein FACS1894199_04110 [Bacteroidia bacterium]|nr:hypothetical protein FACS1894199_04110 [Bacteroidia bacterium]